MKTSFHSVLSTAIGLSLGAFTAVSAIASGFISDATVSGVSLLAIYGLAEIGMLSYAPRPGLRRASVVPVVRREAIVTRREAPLVCAVPRLPMVRASRETALAA